MNIQGLKYRIVVIVADAEFALFIEQEAQLLLELMEGALIAGENMNMFFDVKYYKMWREISGVSEI